MARVEVVMPQMGESVMEGTIIEWSKQIGDEVEQDETLLEIATDKVDSEIPSPESGILVETLAEVDETIEVGQTIGYIETDKEKAKETIEQGAGAGTASSEQAEEPQESAGQPQESEEADAQQSQASSQTESESESQPAEQPTGAQPESEPQRQGEDGRFYSPLVRSIAKEENVSQQELEQIQGTGKEGRVTKEDILNYLESRKSGKPAAPAQPAAQASFERESAASQVAGGTGSISAGELNVQQPNETEEIIKMDRMRKMIAEHMIRSKQTSAHVTTFNEADVTNLVRFREKNKKDFQNRHGIKLTFTPFFIEAAVQAISEFPLINSSVEGDEIHIKKDVNFGMAVSLGEAGKGGLVVPVIKRAQEKNIVGLSKAVNEMAEKARNKQLNPDDLVGGTFSLTNYGSVGNLMGTPIINQPQLAIMGTGAIEKKPVVMETEHGDVIAIRHMMYLSLSYDHRIIDGAHGGSFLQRIKQLLENFDPDRSI